MPFPATILSMFLQASPARQPDPVQEVMDLLEQLTFNEGEGRILEILKGLSPHEMGNFLTILALRTEVQAEFEGLDLEYRQVSFLEKLYQDMNGAEFAAMCLIVKAKLFARKAGGLDEFPALLQRALNKERPPEIPILKRYDPSELTSPSTWGVRQYPSDSMFAADGRLITQWRHHAGFFDVDGSVDDTIVMAPTDLIVLENDTKGGLVDLASVFDLKFLADEHSRSVLFGTVNLVGILLGPGVVAATKGLAKKALVAFVQVIFPAAGQYITEHLDEIAKLKYGPQFIQYWNGFNMLLAAFTIYQVFSPAGRSLWNALTKGKKELVANNPADDLVKEITKQMDQMDDGLKEIEKQLAGQGHPPHSSGPPAGGSGGAGGADPPPGGTGGGGAGGGPGGGAPPSPGGPSSPAKTTIIERKPIDPDIDPAKHPVPIENGSIIATAKSELEIWFEWQRNGGGAGLKIFSSDDGTRFYLARNPAGSAKDIKIPRGFTASRRIIDLVDDFVGAEKCFLAAARRHADANTLIEVGIYSKVLPDGSTRFVVMEGIVGQVAAPARGWKPVAHFHHQGGVARMYHFPAPDDFVTARQAVAGGKSHTETIYSLDGDGNIVRVQYGVDADRMEFFVRLRTGETKYFTDTHYPDELFNQFSAISHRPISDAQKAAAYRALFADHGLSADDYYMAFWAGLM